MKKLIAVTLAVVALPVSAAVAADHPSNTKSPAKACRMLRASDAAAFEAQYRTFGKCVAAHDKAKTRTTAAIKAQQNAAKTCKAARSDDAAGFAEKWGSGRNAFGKCVSATAKSKHSSGDEDTSSDDDDTDS